MLPCYPGFCASATMSGLEDRVFGGDGDLPVKQTWAQGGSWGSRPWWAQYSPWRTFQNESNDFDWDDGQSVIFYLGVIVMRVTIVRVIVMKIFGPPEPKTRWYWPCRPLPGLGSWFPGGWCTCRSGRRLTCHDDNESLDVEKMFAHYYHSDFMTLWKALTVPLLWPRGPSAMLNTLANGKLEQILISTYLDQYKFFSH